MQNSIALNEAAYFNYSYGRYFSNGVLVIATIGLMIGFKLMLFGIDRLNPIAFIGFFMMLGGGACFIPSEMFQINYRTHEYRVAVKIFSKLYGEWTPMGEIKYLSIVHINKSIHLSGSSNGGATRADVIEECRLRLYKGAGYTIDVDDYKTKSSAIEIGRIISDGLTLPLLDATSKPANFI